MSLSEVLTEVEECIAKMQTPQAKAAARALFTEFPMIKPTSGGKYIVYSKSGKRLSKPTGKAAAEKRLKQIEYFKHKGKKK